MSDVPRIGRILDLTGLVVFLAGLGLFGRAWFGFQGLPANLPDVEAEQWAAIAVADGFLRLQRIGGALMALGVAVFVMAWYAARPRSTPRH